MTTSGQITGEFQIASPALDATPYGIVVGPDNNLWVACGGGIIVRATPSGILTEFPVAGSTSFGIVVGPDQNLWFADWGGSRIGRMSTSGTFVTFSTLLPDERPGAIAVAADGNLWFTIDGTKIGRITVAGVITEFSLPTRGGSYFSIAGGPDGNIWVTRYEANIINRVTPSGTVTAFSLDSRFTDPSAIMAGPDGNLWFTHDQAIGRITP
jgi:streptogramin lyase